MPKSKKTPEMVEKVKTLSQMGWLDKDIAKELGISLASAWRYRQIADPDEAQESLQKYRDKNVKRFVNEAWDIIFKLNVILEEKINQGADGFKNARDVAITVGIMIDKLTALETKTGLKKQQTAPISINILPPDGYTTQIIPDPIQVYDESEPIQCDDSGSRVGENVLRLPEGDLDGSGEPWDSGDDSCIDIPEPEGLHSPDAD